jgi:hypothetical protein
MDITKLKLSDNPTLVKALDVDCIWVIADFKKKSEPTTNRGIQCIDWYLQGVFSKMCFSPPKKTLFMPTMGRLKTPWLMFDGTSAFDWSHFQKNSLGMAFKKVAVLCEEKDFSSSFEKEAKKNTSFDYPHELLLVLDH